MPIRNINHYIATLYALTILAMVGVIGWFIRESIYQSQEIEQISSSDKPTSPQQASQPLPQATAINTAPTAVQKSTSKPHNEIIPDERYSAGISLNIDQAKAHN